MFEKGDPMPPENAKNFVGQAYVKRLITRQDLNCPISNVTFEPGCRNNWHKHSHGQILLCITGRGLYQEKGKEARVLLPGDVVEILPNVEHWHGAQADSEFTHLAITTHCHENHTEWLQPVTDDEYAQAQPKTPVTREPVSTLFPMGEKNLPQYSKFFIGQSYLCPLSTNKELNCPTFNVSFEPGCRNNWHIHTGGQILLCVAGRGLYQERNKPAQLMTPGTVIEIPPNVEHWHGATADSWFSHVAIETNPGGKNTWLEPVDDEQYKSAQPK
ncbi:cupin domain-containing protein [Histomonas meleagridis]|uniref:cupin domain-containing protein n=1 Tax=Histomonas meleagridis TaxID=135588 RepID=UPI00355A9D23|nr:cupin domain-containing protein [Histomonas meleagridis]KAH0796396.1 cupin domain-containing protein [Histomonas meleagridis]